DITYMDILGTDPEDVDNTVIRRITLERVHRVLTTLPPRERLVLELRYGLADGKQHPQHEVAQVLGISRSYVSRVEKKAIELLRSAIEEPAAAPGETITPPPAQPGPP
ncbi:MAG: sigma-70 family RNA polymerase sigma factor, partial [Clostridiales bacterium]|nr:sigma-70 family RNA polymerase sigma factor [Clostridiales bacterium]